MEKLSVSDDLWTDILSNKKNKLYYKGERYIELGSHVLQTHSKKNKEVIRVVKVFYNKDRDITIVDFEI